MSKYTLRVNGTSHSVDVAPETPMLWVLRDTLGLVGTKFGCGIGQCSACTIHVDGRPTRSCRTTVSTIGDAAVMTIEGLDGSAEHPLQQAWTELDVPQCGYFKRAAEIAAGATSGQGGKR